MPRGRRKTGSLARLEQELSALNARRHQIISELTSVVEQLSLGAMVRIAELGQASGLGAELPSGRPVDDQRKAAKPTRTFSPAARAKLRAAAKARWAAAKKAGKTKLGQ